MVLLTKFSSAAPDQGMLILDTDLPDGFNFPGLESELNMVVRYETSCPEPPGACKAEASSPSAFKDAEYRLSINDLKKVNIEAINTEETGPDETITEQIITEELNLDLDTKNQDSIENQMVPKDAAGSDRTTCAWEELPDEIRERIFVEVNKLRCRRREWTKGFGGAYFRWMADTNSSPALIVAFRTLPRSYRHALGWFAKVNSTINVGLAQHYIPGSIPMNKYEREVITSIKIRMK